MDVLQTFRDVLSALLQQEPLLGLVALLLFRLDRQLTACLKSHRELLDQLLQAVLLSERG